MERKLCNARLRSTRASDNCVARMSNDNWWISIIPCLNWMWVEAFPNAQSLSEFWPFFLRLSATYYVFRLGALTLIRLLDIPFYRFAGRSLPLCIICTAYLIRIKREIGPVYAAVFWVGTRKHYSLITIGWVRRSPVWYSPFCIWKHKVASLFTDVLECARCTLYIYSGWRVSAQDFGNSHWAICIKFCQEHLRRLLVLGIRAQDR